MSYQPANTQQAYLTTEFVVPHPANEPELFYEVMNQRERDNAKILNVKENGFYMNQETINSQQWYSTSPQTQRQAFRKVIPITAVAIGVNNFAHNLGTIDGFTFTRIYGVIQNTPTTRSTPIPQSEATTLNRNVTVEVVAADVVITLQAGSPYVGFTGNVVLEYLKS